MQSGWRVAPREGLERLIVARKVIDARRLAAERVHHLDVGFAAVGQELDEANFLGAAIDVDVLLDFGLG